MPCNGQISQDFLENFVFHTAAISKIRALPKAIPRPPPLRLSTAMAFERVDGTEPRTYTIAELLNTIIKHGIVLPLENEWKEVKVPGYPYDCLPRLIRSFPLGMKDVDRVSKRSAATKFRFLDLPVSVRKKIFRMVLTTRDWVTPYRYFEDRAIHKLLGAPKKPRVNLLKVFCKQSDKEIEAVLDEARNVVYGDNFFYFREPRDLRYFVNVVGWEIVARMKMRKNVWLAPNFFINTSDSSDLQWIVEHGPAVVEAMKGLSMWRHGWEERSDAGDDDEDGLSEVTIVPAKQKAKTNPALKEAVLKPATSRPTVAVSDFEISMQDLGPIAGEWSSEWGYDEVQHEVIDQESSSADQPFESARTENTLSDALLEQSMFGLTLPTIHEEAEGEITPRGTLQDTSEEEFYPNLVTDRPTLIEPPSRPTKYIVVGPPLTRRPQPQHGHKLEHSQSKLGSAEDVDISQPPSRPPPPPPKTSPPVSPPLQSLQPASDFRYSQSFLNPRAPPPVPRSVSPTPSLSVSRFISQFSNRQSIGSPPTLPVGAFAFDQGDGDDEHSPSEYSQDEEESARLGQLEEEPEGGGWNEEIDEDEEDSNDEEDEDYWLQLGLEADEVVRATMEKATEAEVDSNGKAPDEQDKETSPDTLVMTGTVDEPEYYNDDGTTEAPVNNSPPPLPTRISARALSRSEEFDARIDEMMKVLHGTR
ncbi:hypothetical protein MMC06_003026 [Schaereria dolodes]|nr:hypothetical protein [Schaereria dolodes]